MVKFLCENNEHKLNDDGFIFALANPHQLYSACMNQLALWQANEHINYKRVEVVCCCDSLMEKISIP